MKNHKATTRPRRTVAGFATVIGAASAMMMLSTGVSGAVPVPSPDRAIDVPIAGGCVAHIGMYGQVYTSILPLSGTPFSREVFLDNHAVLKLNCPDGAKLPSKYTLEIGYQIAPNADISDGFSVGASPQVANAKAYACNRPGTPPTTTSCPAVPSAQTTVTNTTTLTLPVSQKFKPGPITEVAIQKRDFAEDKTVTPVKKVPTAANINVNMWHLVLNNAVGVVTARSYVKLISSSSNTDDINVAYGLPVVLR